VGKEKKRIEKKIILEQNTTDPSKKTEMQLAFLTNRVKEAD